ncbi:hypothetical protein SDC9_70787 [bioreactor metagenome]|uniref:Ribbon-helix-helix protein CopG domain-containing protein n=1 Tax=bioreactor metagenome TaxID=1076179 RepID=A0A644Y6W5_9ZZZZ
MSRETEKITVSLPLETLRLADEKYAAFGFPNRSKFIDAAIREYVSRDLLRQFSGELAEIYGRLEHTEIRQLEEHLSKLSYKTAVELAQINLLLASILEVPDADTQKLRGRAVKLVNQSRGYVPLKDALRNRMEIGYLEGPEDDYEQE